MADFEAGARPPCSCGGCPTSGAAIFSAARAIAGVREQAAYWQQQAAAAELCASRSELALDEADAEVRYLQRCLARQQEATAAAESRAVAAKAALAAYQQVCARAWRGEGRAW
jgi:hypothetical protein